MSETQKIHIHLQVDIEGDKKDFGFYITNKPTREVILKSMFVAGETIIDFVSDKGQLSE